MTSGHFANFPVDSIYVDRDVRQRRELKNIEELADSINRIGLIHPPVIERDGKLRAGERRWTAIKSLGWTSMPVQFTDEVDEPTLQIIELEENIRRETLDWQDECKAVAAYHELQTRISGTWTQEQTGTALGMSRVSVIERITIAKSLEGGNTRLEAAGKYSVAKNIVKRDRERAAANVAEKIADVMEAPARTVPLTNANFHEWVTEYTGPTFNFIHCDFPYGVGANNTQQGSEVLEKGGYEDTAEVYWELVSSLRDAMSGIVAESAHLMFWFSMDYYTPTKKALEEMSWRVNPFPLIWHKSDNTGIVPDAQRGPRRIYETAFMASRGDRKLTANGTVANAIAWPGQDKSIHMSEKPKGMLKHFMRMMVDEHSRVLDPTAGSGNALKVATGLGAPSVLGLEINQEFYERSVEAYYAGEE